MHRSFGLSKPLSLLAYAFKNLSPADILYPEDLRYYQDARRRERSWIVRSQQKGGVWDNHTGALHPASPVARLERGIVVCVQPGFALGHQSVTVQLLERL